MVFHCKHGSIADSAIPVTERFDPINLVEKKPSLPSNPKLLIYPPAQQHPANASKRLAVQQSSSHWRGTSQGVGVLESVVEQWFGQEALE